MKTEQWDRVRRLAEELLDRTPYDRAAVLEQVEADDAEVYAELLAILAEAGAEPERPHLPGYELLAEVGHGGMGVVYRARDLALGRIVAVKMIRGGGCASAEEHARFRREARAAAALRHPNLVTVYEVGGSADAPYLAMEYVAGGTLTRRLAASPLTPTDAARVVAQVADGIAHAHRQGVIHRDLKPGNVLLQQPECVDDTTATVIESAPPAAPSMCGWSVKVADFGLARRLDDPRQTQTGAVLGTPSYVAPEQAAGLTSAVGPPADVYALGAILYECLTGRPPFKGANAADTLAQVIERDPVPPRQLQPSTPYDLETICLKCLRKEPRHRYATADDLADDLRRFLDGRPVRARRVAVWERAWRWGRRKPALAASLAVAVVALVAAVVGVATAVQQTARVAIHEDIARFLGVVARTAAKPFGWSEDNLDDLAILARRNTVDRASLREQAVEAILGVDLARWPKWTIDFRAGALAFSRDGKKLAAAHYVESPIRVYDVESGSLLHELPLPPYQFHRTEKSISLAFSPDGTRLAAGTRSGHLYCWDLTCPGEPPQRSPRFAPDRVLSLDFTANGDSLIAFCDANGSLTRWALPLSERAEPVANFSERVASVAFRRDGGLLACAVGRRVLFLDPESFRQARLPTAELDHPLFFPRFSPDGMTLAGMRGGVIHLIDVASGRLYFEPLSRRVHESAADLDFSPDGVLLVSAAHGGLDRGIRIWERASGRLIAEHGFGPQDAGASAVHPTRPLLAISTQDGKLVIRELRGLAVQSVLAHHALLLKDFCRSPEDGPLATLDDAEVAVWSVGGELLGRREHGLPRDRRPSVFAFNPSGTGLLFGEPDKARRWDLDGRGTTDVVSIPADDSKLGPDGKPASDLRGHREAVNSVAISPDGAWLASGSDDRTVRLHVRRGETAFEHAWTLRFPSGSVHRVAFHPDGRSLFVLVRGETALRQIHLDRLRTELRAVGLDEPSWPPFAAPSPTPEPSPVRPTADEAAERGFRLQGEGLPGPALLWFARALELAGDTNPTWADEVRTLFDASHPMRLDGECAGHTDRIHHLAFNADGTLMLSASRDRTARLWDVNKRTCRFQVAHEAPVEGCEFLPDGGRFLTWGQDRTVRVWDTQTGRAAALEPIQHGAAVTAGAVRPGGRIFASGDEEGLVRIWDLESYKPAREFRPKVIFPAPAPVHRLAFSPDGRRLLVGFGGGAQVHDAETGRSVGDSFPAPGGGKAVAFSPDGTALATSASPGGRLRHADTFNPFGEALGRDALGQLAYSPDGRIVATEADSRIVLFDARSGRPVSAVAGEIKSVGFAFHPDGVTLATADADDVIRFHRAVPYPVADAVAALRPWAQRQTGRRLTDSGNDVVLSEAERERVAKAELKGPVQPEARPRPPRPAVVPIPEPPAPMRPKPLAVAPLAELSGGYASAHATATDAAGNVYLAGACSSTLRHGETQVPLRSGESPRGGFLVQCRSGGGVQWAVPVAPNGNDSLTAVTTTREGHVVVAGLVAGPSQGTRSVAQGGECALLARIDPDGRILASRSICSSRWVRGLAVATDATGNLYLGGQFTGEAQFGEDVLGRAVTKQCERSEGTAFVVSYDPKGKVRWARTLDRHSRATCRAIAVGCDGALWVAGTFWGEANFGSLERPHFLKSRDTSDAFVWKLTAEGNPTRVWSVGASRHGESHAITVDRQGDVVVCGTLKGTARAGTFALDSGRNTAPFVARLSPAGETRWLRCPAENGGASAVAIDSVGCVYTAGYFAGTADFDPGPAEQLLDARPEVAMFLSKLDPAGNLVRADRIVASAASNRGVALTLGPMGVVYFAGSFSGAAVFGDGPNAERRNAVGDSDVYLLRLTPPPTRSDTRPHPAAALNLPR